MGEDGGLEASSDLSDHEDEVGRINQIIAKLSTQLDDMSGELKAITRKRPARRVLT